MKSVNSQKYLYLCPEKYLESADYFMEICESTIDSLRQYNFVDCRILIEAVKNHYERFKKDFSVDFYKKIVIARSRPRNRLSKL